MRVQILLLVVVVACLHVPRAIAQDAGAQDAGAQDAGAQDAGAQEPQSAGAQEPQSAGAQEPQAQPEAEHLPAALEPTCRIQLSPTKIHTGDVVRLTLRCDIKPGTRLTVAKEQTFAPLEILDQHLLPAKKEHEVAHALRLLALAPGEVDLGPVALHVNGPDGKRYAWQSAPVGKLSVASVLGNEPNAEPKPARPPQQVIEDDFTLAYVLGGLLFAALVVLLTLLFSRWWRKRQKPAPPAAPPRPPWERAQQELTRLRLSRERAFEEGRAVEWVDALSDSMRKYLGERYGFDGLESTSDELLRQLHRQKTPELSLPELSALLGDWDLIKFARATPDSAQCEQWVERALGLVSITVPRMQNRADTEGDAAS